MLEIEGLSVSFRSENQIIRAVDNVSFQLRRGETLVIVGERDWPDIRRMADILGSSIEGARKVVLAGAGHVPNMEQPDEFNRTVLEFLHDVEAPSPDWT